MEKATGKTIVFFGPSGSGKGTQAQLLIDHLKGTDATTPVHFLEVGKMLRGLIEREDETGKRIQHIVDNGGLVPPFAAAYTWTNKLINEVQASDHVVFDGAGRTIPEAQSLADAMEFYGRDYTVIVFELSEEEAIKRIQDRDEGRADDSDIEKVRRRLAWFEDSVKPAIKVLQEQGATIQTIDGSPSIEEIHEEVKRTLNV